MATDLTRAYKFLDKLPEILYTPVVTHRAGDLVQRCLDVLQLRHDLLSGKATSIMLFNWANPDRLRIIESKFIHGDLISSCKNNEQRTDQAILNILEYLNREKDDFNPQSTHSCSLHDPATHSLKNQYAKQQKIKAVLNGVSVVRKLGWNLSQGLLEKTEWSHILLVHDIIKKSPRLQYIIQHLGRSIQKDIESTAGQEHAHPDSTFTNREWLDQYSVHAPMETSGISYSDDIGRMLPFELSKLGHKKLKLLWHARRAERMLLSYQYEGVLSEHIPVQPDQRINPYSDRKSSVSTQGPMIICLDTSASMKGKPEQMAKAIVFEMMRVCINDCRQCMLLAFSGPGEIHEYHLDHSEQGWNNILDVLSQSFHGGTDLATVISRSLALIDHQQWRTADICLVSDSRFVVSDELFDQVKSKQTKYNLRVYGINVSRWQSTEMEKLCQSVYRLMYPQHLADV